MIIQVLKNNFVLSKTWADVSAQYVFSVSGSAKTSRGDRSSTNLGSFVAAELETKASAKPDPDLASDLEVKLIADVSVECSNMVAITQLNKKGLKVSSAKELKSASLEPECFWQNSAMTFWWDYAN